MQFRDCLVVASVSLLLAFGTPANAQSATPADVATAMGAIAGLMQSCNGDKTAIDRLEKWVATMPVGLRPATIEYAKKGLQKGIMELSYYSTTEWIKVPCDSTFVKDKLPSIFAQLLKDAGVR